MTFIDALLFCFFFRHVWLALKRFCFEYVIHIEKIHWRTFLLGMGSICFIFFKHELFSVQNKDDEIGESMIEVLEVPLPYSTWSIVWRQAISSDRLNCENIICFAHLQFFGHCTRIFGSFVGLGTGFYNPVFTQAFCVGFTSVHIVETLLACDLNIVTTWIIIFFIPILDPRFR